jgi:hypothetical protein
VLGAAVQRAWDVLVDGSRLGLEALLIVRSIGGRGIVYDGGRRWTFEGQTSTMGLALKTSDLDALRQGAENAARIGYDVLVYHTGKMPFEGSTLSAKKL